MMEDMRNSILKTALWLTLLGTTLPKAAKAQIYNVGNNDGFSFACAGSIGYELLLPVRLHRFAAHCVPEGIRVSCVLQEETDNVQVVLEKSSNGKEFHALKFGQSNNPSLIEYLDRDKTGRVQYYRLKKQRAGASPEYSTVISSTCQSTNPNISPNPTPGLFTIQSEEPGGSIIIKDLSGKCVCTFQIAQAKQQIDVRHLKDGIYSLELRTGHLISLHRIIIAR